MIESVENEIFNNGDKAKLISIKYLESIKKEIEELKDTGFLNDFQKFIVNDLYELDLPETEFEIKSILVVASPSPAFVKVAFNWQGEKVPLVIPSTYIDMNSAPKIIEQYLDGFLNNTGYHIKYAPKLPRKLLAVKSGLGEYGRNNICYVDGLGSFLNLSLYFSDIPCAEENLRDIEQMDLCKTCKACLNNCPTGAIIEDRFLVNNERCLTYFNESDSKSDFPEWISPLAHNSVVGCCRCQAICPKNKEYLNNIVEPVEFNEEETLLLLEGKPLEQFSKELALKIEKLDMSDYLNALPRNLKALLADR
jgi:epoxyqueuosine reductase